jgi:hypothetical protein
MRAADVADIVSAIRENGGGAGWEYLADALAACLPGADIDAFRARCEGNPGADR